MILAKHQKSKSIRTLILLFLFVIAFPISSCRTLQGRRLTITDPAVLEDVGEITFTISLSTPNPNGIITVELIIEDETAEDGKDYTSEPTYTRIFNANDTTKEITIPIVVEEKLERDETFHVKVVDVAGDATAEKILATGTILNDDQAQAAVFAGTQRSCAIKPSGELWCWGKSSSEQDKTVPKRLAADKIWVTASMGNDHQCAIDIDTDLYCWGSDVYGQLGIGTGDDSTSAPQKVPNHSSWVFVSAGIHHTCAIKESGSLYCWGESPGGKLGLGEDLPDERIHTPQQVGEDLDWESVDAGYNHSCGLKTTGLLNCWGMNFFGALGTGDPDPFNAYSPKPVSGDIVWRSFSSINHGCGVARDGLSYCWGYNGTGQLGLGEGVGNKFVPTVFDGFSVDLISTGSTFTCGIRINSAESADSGDLWCWGRNYSGELGIGEIGEEDFPEPERVNFDHDWFLINAGHDHACALKTTGDIYCWGDNTYGQIGDGTAGADRYVPTQITFSE